MERFKSAIHPDAWSINDLKWFLQLCRNHHITVIPKVPLLGHMEWLLQWPWWSHLQENADRREICPTHPEVPIFVSKLLKEVLQIFPDAPCIHLGGDESFSLGTCQRCLDTGKTKSRIYLDHYLPLIQQVQAAGRRPMIYGDMILGHPEIMDNLPRSLVICDWDYWSGTGPGRNVWGYQGISKVAELKHFPPQFNRFRKYFTSPDDTLASFPYATFLKDEGFDVVLMPSARCMGDNYCTPRTWLHARNACAAGQKAAELGLEGLIITSWAVRFNPLETNWPSIAAGAWSYREPQLELEQISERFAFHFFGLDCTELFNIFDLLSPTLPDLQAHHANPYPPDIVHNYIHTLYKDPHSESCRFVAQNLSQIKKSYDLGLNKLQKLYDKVIRNRTMYQHWLLMAKTLKHKADRVVTLIELVQNRKLPRRGFNKILNEIEGLSAEYQKVLGKTILEVSLDMELRLRFEEVNELITTC
ncbi:MAG: family 20 glycosylhydrolase [Phycisphaerae bacterium]